MLKPANASKLVPVECHDLKRLGAPHDGGYVVPLDAVKRTKHLISIGVSLDWSFEEEFLRRNPIVTVHCYDHTISGWSVAIHSLKHLAKLLFGPSKKRLQEVFKYFSYRGFFQGQVHHHRSRVWYNHDNDSVTMRDVFALAPRGEIFLKIDIEGSEYRILDGIADYAGRIDAMAIEFHDIDIMAEQFDTAIAKIRKDFHIVHIHGNNFGGVAPCGLPNVLEITFQNRRLFKDDPRASTLHYPVHGLDARNDPTRPDLKLHFGNDGPQQ